LKYKKGHKKDTMEIDPIKCEVIFNQSDVNDIDNNLEAGLTYKALFAIWHVSHAIEAVADFDITNSYSFVEKSNARNQNRLRGDRLIEMRDRLAPLAMRPEARFVITQAEQIKNQAAS
jgi:hypothetical protein